MSERIDYGEEPGEQGDLDRHSEANINPTVEAMSGELEAPDQWKQVHWRFEEPYISCSNCDVARGSMCADHFADYIPPIKKTRLAPSDPVEPEVKDWKYRLPDHTVWVLCSAKAAEWYGSHGYLVERADPVEGEPVAIYQWRDWHEIPWVDTTPERYGQLETANVERRIVYTRPSVEGERAREAPITGFTRDANSAAILTAPGELTFRDLPPGDYLIYHDNCGHRRSSPSRQ